MEYQTRHMEALKPMYHEGNALEVGDCFYATPIDAGYFAKHGRAREIPIPASLSGLTQSAPPVVEVKAQPEPESKTESDPVAVNHPIEVESQQVDSPAEAAGTAAVETVSDEKAAESTPADPVVTAAPRRGRPPRAPATTEPQA